MGGGGSKSKVPPRPAKENKTKKPDPKESKEPEHQEHPKHPDPDPHNSSLTRSFHVTAVDAEVKQKAHGKDVILEISPTGFRLLRASTEEPVQAYPWGQIHSWAHGHDKFSFRYFEERTKQPHFYSFHLKDVEKLLAHMQLVIDDILTERKSKSIPPEDFQDLLGLLFSSEANLRLDFITTATKLNYFTSAQARQMVESLNNSFDKVEAARLLHARLVDQNHFATVLEVLDCDDDRENVWARISELKKHVGLVGAKTNGEAAASS